MAEVAVRSAGAAFALQLVSRLQQRAGELAAAPPPPAVQAGRAGLGARAPAAAAQHAGQSVLRRLGRALGRKRKRAAHDDDERAAAGGDDADDDDAAEEDSRVAAAAAHKRVKLDPVAQLAEAKTNKKTKKKKKKKKTKEHEQPQPGDVGGSEQAAGADRPAAAGDEEFSESDFASHWTDDGGSAPAALDLAAPPSAAPPQAKRAPPQDKRAPEGAAATNPRLCELAGQVEAGQLTLKRALDLLAQVINNK